jgi:hypothetical protein
LAVGAGSVAVAEVVTDSAAVVGVFAVVFAVVVAVVSETGSPVMASY